MKNLICQSCVDEKISALEHFLAALRGLMKRKNTKKELESYQDSIGLTYSRKTGVYQLIGRIYCPKVQQLELHKDKSKPCPIVISLHCTYGTDGHGKDQCLHYGVAKLGILEA